MFGFLKRKEGRAMAERTDLPAHAESRSVRKREETRTEEWFVRPSVDIYEKEDGLTVIADLPGVLGDDLNVKVEDNILTIEAKPKYSEPGEPFFREFKMTGFFRQFQLPEEVDQERISGELRDGVLKLHLPRLEKAKPRKIKVKVK